MPPTSAEVLESSGTLVGYVRVWETPPARHFSAASECGRGWKEHPATFVIRSTCNKENYRSTR